MPMICFPSGENLDFSTPDPGFWMRNSLPSHHHFPPWPLLWLHVPSRLKVVSDAPKTKDAQLCHVPTTLGQLDFLGGGAPKCSRSLVLLAVSSLTPPDTDLSVFPIVPPVDPA